MPSIVNTDRILFATMPCHANREIGQSTGIRGRSSPLVSSVTGPHSRSGPHGISAPAAEQHGKDVGRHDAAGAQQEALNQIHVQPPETMLRASQPAGPASGTKNF
jgi:hypothetical protein